MTVTFNKHNKINVQKALEGSESYKNLNAEEWHQFVQHYNYDDGIGPMQWMIEQKIIDKGTVLCLYWHLQPDYYQTQETRNPNNPEFKLIMDIEEKYTTGFYEREQFSFNPADQFNTDHTIPPFIPGEMLEKTLGIPFDPINLSLAYLRTPNGKESNTIQKKIDEAIKIIQITNPDFTPVDCDQTIQEIANTVEYWKDKDQGKMKIKTLYYLFDDCVQQKHGWNWMVWDWETGSSIGVSHPSRKWSSIGDNIILHTNNGLKPTSFIVDFFNDLADLEGNFKDKPNPYFGIGLLMITNL
ncbi:DUF4274 domain-containing protein [Pedobacter metabolipauper]|uniref:Uncharacterized protein DUF4274 n=1 Tax=Pedobacter metabolipauper TaxID=425513 RepID=A0A4R6SZA9_9SPHI|nr:DUF4274 domain-containing protein [Pedobacter metabolipauper]TDQ11407.1 uncharacterized protein DUF4274 [Pedobacter metabolipauper]